MAVQQVGAVDFETEVLKATGWVVVDFYAAWCPPCRALAPLLDRWAAENADRVRVVKVDSDVDEDLAEQFTVKKIPTLIAFRGGQEVRRAINPQSRAALDALIQDE